MVTMTVGGAMLGNCAIGRVLIPSTPRNRRMIEMTIANAGRWRIFVNMFLRLSPCFVSGILAAGGTRPLLEEFAPAVELAEQVVKAGDDQDPDDRADEHAAG